MKQSSITMAVVLFRNSVLGPPLERPHLLNSPKISSAVYLNPEDILTQKVSKKHINHIGIEHVIELETYTPTWKSHPEIKRACNAAQNANIIFKMCSPLDISKSLIQDMKHIQDLWLQKKPCKTHNTSFMLPTLEFPLEKRSVVFCAYSENQLCAYQIYYPIKNNFGAQIGYLQEYQRFNPDGPKGCSYALTNHAANYFKRKGLRYLSLGLAPFEGYEDYSKSMSFYYLWKHICSNADEIFNFNGLIFHKNRFKAKRVPVYMISKSKLPGKDLLWILSKTLGGLKVKNYRYFIRIGSLFLLSFTTFYARKIIVQNPIKRFGIGLR